MSTEQGHKGEGDNVAGNKTVNNIFHLIPKITKQHWLIFTSIIVTLGTIYFIYEALENRCIPQEQKLQVDIAYFEANGDQDFTINLINTLNDELASYPVKVDGYDKFIYRNLEEIKASVNEIVSRKCNYNGLIIYGNRNASKQSKNFQCRIDVKVEVDTSHLLQNPPIEFTIPKQARYVSFFVRALVKYYLGYKKESVYDLQVFLREREVFINSSISEIEKRNRREATKKVTSLVYSYLGISNLDLGNELEAEKHIRKARALIDDAVTRLNFDRMMAYAKEKTIKLPKDSTRQVIRNVDASPDSIKETPVLIKKTQVTRVDSLLSNDSSNIREKLFQPQLQFTKQSYKLGDIVLFAAKKLRYPKAYIEKKVRENGIIKLKCTIDKEMHLKKYVVERQIGNYRLFTEESLRIVKEFLKILREQKFVVTDTVFIATFPFNYKNLRGLDMSFLDFPKADFKRFNFNNTNLKRVDFRWAKVTSANLIGANLHWTLLLGTDLRMSILPEIKRFDHASFNRKTKINGCLTTDPNWMNKFSKYVLAGGFDIKKYQFIRLPTTDVQEASRYNQYLRNWPSHIPLYQIKLKSGFKE